MISWQPTTLLRLADSVAEPAEIVRDLTPGEIQAAEDIWYPALIALLHPLLLAGATRRDLPEHKHWEWYAKAQRFYGEAGYEFWGVTVAGEMQGMMLVNVSEVCRVPAQVGAPITKHLCTYSLPNNSYFNILANAVW